MRWLSVVLGVSMAAVAFAKPPPPAPDYAALFQELSAPPAAPHLVPAPAAADPLPWAVGQWARFKNTNPESGAVTYHRTSIVGHDDCGWWVESVSTTGDSGSVLKICYKVPAWPRPETTEPIVQVIEARDGDEKPVVVDIRTKKGAKMAGQLGNLFRGAFQPLTYTEGAAPESITVESGTFEGCSRVDVEASAMTTRVTGVGWVHPAVPVFGTVNGQVGGILTEVVDFGGEGTQAWPAPPPPPPEPEAEPVPPGTDVPIPEIMPMPPE